MAPERALQDERAVACRMRGHGSVPVDPADVRKVAWEEPPGDRPLSDEVVSRASDQLFGSWEMNWMAYNYAHDVELPGYAGNPLVYFICAPAQSCIPKRRPRKDGSVRSIRIALNMRSR
jgi:hypothetical protein